ncbi:MAG: hypothetical protein JW748_01650 [Anaerolineales bacterium]|nr:hypothetical protein [Anaerolineales bacterium]
MKRRGFFAFLLAGTLLVLSACSTSVNGTRRVSTRSEGLTFTNSSDTYENELTIEPGMVFHTLSIKRIKLTSGGLTLTLIGPDGSVVWEQSFADSADFRRDLSLDALLGKWILRIELTGATGSYDLVWRAGNTP